MPTVDINYWAVLVGAASSMLIGYVWYHLKVFGRTWMRMIGKTEEELKGRAGPAMGGAVVLALITSYVLAHIIGYVDAVTIGEGIVTGLWMWFGFIFTSIALQNLFAQRPFGLTLINSGYHLMQFAVAGAILAAWPA